MRELVDVAGRAGDQVAGAGPLDGRQRQGDDAVHELLAQVGEDLLGEHERLSSRGPRERRLDDDRAREQQRDPVDVPEGRPRPHRVDEPAEQRGPGEPGQRGDGVQPEHRAQPAPVLAQQQARLAAHALAAGHRQLGVRVAGVGGGAVVLAHASSPLVTVWA